MSDLGSATWQEIADEPGPILVLPLGACEQHGPHLPLATDTLVASALAEALAQLRPGTVVGPPVAVGASGEHAGFPGTLSIGTAALATVVVELVRSADWAAGVVIVNGHGGNLDALRTAEATLRHDGHRVLAWWPDADAGPRADAHAGWTETSLLLHLAPDLVRVDRAASGDARPLATIMPALRANGVGSVSANGVLGDPAGASAAAGAELFDRLVDDLVARFDSWVS